MDLPVIESASIKFGGRSAATCGSSAMQLDVLSVALRAKVQAEIISR
jgi:hypothetical protein